MGKNLKFIMASVYALPFKDREFDYVVSTELIEHLEYPEKMTSEIKRMWNQKGKVIISTPIKLTEKLWDKTHFREFSELRDHHPKLRLVHYIVLTFGSVYLNHHLFLYSRVNKCKMLCHDFLLTQK